MARLTPNSNGTLSNSIWETHVGTASQFSISLASITLAGVFTNTFTAPNTSNKVTGVWLSFGSVPTNGGTITVTLQQSTVDTVCSTTATAATITTGMNYFRFATPFQFTTTAANAYRYKITNSVGTSGQLNIQASGIMASSTTIDSVGTCGTTDDLWIGGSLTADVLTPRVIEVSGTSNVFGSGADTTVNNATRFSIGMALQVANGGTYRHDTTVSTTSQIRGSITCYTGGLIDLSANQSDRTIISRLVMDQNGTSGNFAFLTPTLYDGELRLNGMQRDVTTKVVSGTGTIADPLIVADAVDWDVDDEIIFGAFTDYTHQEKRFIVTRNSSTSFVLANTAGGSPLALAHSHVGAHCSNLTRNMIVTPLNIAHGIKGFNNSPQNTNNFSYCRMEYISSNSGHAVWLTGQASTLPPSVEGLVAYRVATGNRDVLLFSATPATFTARKIITYDTVATNISNAGLTFSGTTNATLEECIGYGAGGAAGGLHFSLRLTAANITFRDCHSYGANAGNNVNASGLHVSGSYNLRFVNCTFNASRRYGVQLTNASDCYWLNCDIGNLGANGTSNIIVNTESYNSNCIFENCLVGTNLLENYLNQVDGSEIRFQTLNGNSSNHGWYTRRGSIFSSGTGLTETTTRTPGSLALAMKPETSGSGLRWDFQIPANPNTQVGVSGYVFRNTNMTFDAYAELFLPGSDTDGTPDVQYQIPADLNQWLPFNLAKLYTASNSRYATVRIRVTGNTAGAVLFIDDIYDAGTVNKVGGLDLWYQGKPSQIQVASDFSAVPAQTWAYSSNNTTAGTMGRILTDIEANTDVTQAKVDQL